jgi:hypothetical protein
VEEQDRARLPVAQALATMHDRLLSVLRLTRALVEEPERHPKPRRNGILTQTIMWERGNRAYED